MNPLASDRSEPGLTRLDVPRAQLELLSGRLNRQLELTTFGPAGPDRIEGLIRELRQTYLSTVGRLAFLVEAEDAYTAHQLERCRQYAAQHRSTRTWPPKTCSTAISCMTSARRHPRAILTKPRPLSAPEAEIMRTDPTLGVSILEPMRFLDERAIDVIRFHHERFDGTGHPQGLGGDEIPLAARIFSIVDAFDATSTDRPYRRALTLDREVAELLAGSGTQFDPGVVGSFLKIVEELPSFAPGLPA